MGSLRPDWNIGVSLWGQGDLKKQLWVRDHFKNIRKTIAHISDQPSTIQDKNVTHYYHAALAWTKRIRKGNLAGIIDANMENMTIYISEFGKPDLISVQACYPGAFIGQHLSEHFGVPYHVHVRLGGFMFEHLLNDLGGSSQGLIHAVNMASAITTTSNFQKKELSSHFENVEVLHNPVNIPDDLKIENGKHALAIGRLEPEKGFDRLLEAVSRVSETKLQIIGLGSQLDKLQKLMRRLAIDDRVTFLGAKSRNETNELLSKCGYLVLPSRYETFGNVILEALAIGKPVLATRCGGPEEIVVSETGLLCDNSTEGLEHGLHEMNSHFMEFESSKIAAHVVEHFSPEKWILQVEEVFKNALRK
ncbi:MAG: glycosyltransferase [Ekhidna sp.]